MTTEMIVNVSPRETRAGLLENGVLQELFIERASRMGLAGNLYKGRVSRVLPGMQAAFIDIGLERTAFLHVSDIVQPADAEGSGDETRTENIRELVSEGGDILVQVLKDPLGTKGARLTTFITIPSRYLVYMPFGHGVGISARIETEEERLRLREKRRILRLDPLPCVDRGGHLAPQQLEVAEQHRRAGAGLVFGERQIDVGARAGAVGLDELRLRELMQSFVTPAGPAATSCAPPPKARQPRHCMPTCCSCASCGKCSRAGRQARVPERWCTRTCRCHCA